MKLLITIVSVALLLQGETRASGFVGRVASEIQSITTGAKMFEEIYGVFPPEGDWVRELQGASDAIVNTRQVRLLEVNTKHGFGQMIDPWGSPYVYRYPPRQNARGVDVYSLGADRKSLSDGNDPDDINNWNPDHPWGSYYHFRYHVRPRLYLAGSVAAATVLLLLVCSLRKGRNQASESGVPADDD